ncbi:MAG: META domain-containing protein [Paracoccaceae bacterium]
MKKTLAVAPLLLWVCGAGAEVPPDYRAIEWRIVANDDAPYGSSVTIAFDDPARISGQGPCNRWFAELKSTLPEFRIGPVGATMMACPDLDKEAAFLAMLEKVTRAEITAPDRLTLTGPDIAPLVFARPVD